MWKQRGLAATPTPDAVGWYWLPGFRHAAFLSWRHWKTYSTTGRCKTIPDKSLWSLSNYKTSRLLLTLQSTCCHVVRLVLLYRDMQPAWWLQCGSNDDWLNECTNYLKRFSLSIFPLLGQQWAFNELRMGGIRTKHACFIGSIWFSEQLRPTFIPEFQARLTRKNRNKKTISISDCCV